MAPPPEVISVVVERDHRGGYVLAVQRVVNKHHHKVVVTHRYALRGAQLFGMVQSAEQARWWEERGQP